LAFLNRVEYHNSDFKKFICEDLATWCKNLVNVGSVTPEFKRGKDIQPIVDQQFGYIRLAAPLQTLRRSVLSFLGRSLLSFASPIC